MASITEKVKDGKIVSFKFRACVGRDENGKQVFKCMTWYPAADMTKAKSKKEAAAAADEWEREQKKAFLLEEEERKTQEAEKIEKMKVLSFGRFVREIWFPLAVDDGEHSPSTIAMYKHILNVILPRFGEMPLQKITGLQITAYLNWLRKDYRTAYGLPLADKTVKHH